MKTIYLLRHAKAEPDGLTDHARPLAERGRRDARRMGRHLATLSPQPERIVVSTALRTRETLEGIQETSGLDAPVEATRALYETDGVGVLAFLRELPDDVRAVLVVGHEPTMSETTVRLTQTGVRVPTCTLIRVDVDVAAWRDVAWGTGTLVSVVSPDALGTDTP